MAREHEDFAYEMILKKNKFDEIRNTMRKKFDINDNIIGISITRASKRLIESNPEYKRDK